MEEIVNSFSICVRGGLDLSEMLVYKNVYVSTNSHLYYLGMTRLDFARTDTFFPAAWVMVKACFLLCLGNLWWYNAPVPGTASMVVGPDMSGQAAHRLIASCGIIASLLECKLDALVASYACAQSVFTEQRSLARSMRLVVDMFIIILALRAAPRAEPSHCGSLFLTCLGWAVMAGVVSIVEYSAAHAREAVPVYFHAAQPACALCVVVLAASTATSPCFSLEFQQASFSELSARTCLYTTISIWRCYIVARRPEWHAQRDAPNMAVYGWVMVADVYLVGAGVFLSVLGVGALCVFGHSSLGSVESGGLVDVKNVVPSMTGLLGGSSTLTAPVSHVYGSPPIDKAHSPPASVHIHHMDDELVQRLRSMESSVALTGAMPGRRRAGGAIFGV